MQAAWYLPWVFAGVTVGTVYLAAILVERICPAPVRRRVVWQVAAGCSLALGVAALTGLDRAVGTLLLDSLFPHSQASATTLHLPIASGVAADADADPAFTGGTESDRSDARSGIPNPTFNHPAAATDIGRASPSPGEAPESGAYCSPPAHAESSTESAARIMGADITRASLLGGIWLLGAFAVWLRQQSAYLRLRSACVPKRKLTDGPIPKFVAGWAEQLQLPPRIPVYLLPGLKTPAAFGIFRPALGLPEQFTTTHLDPAEQAILLHELAHLASRDPVWRYLAGLGSAVLWWHPAAWVIRRRLHWASELAADEASLLLTDGPRQLARGLLRYGRIVCPGLSSVVGVGGDGFRSVLARRVARLMSLSQSTREPDRRSAMRTASTTTIVVTALAVVFSTVWAGALGPLPQEEGGTVMTRFAASWRGSLSAVTLAALLSPWSATAEEGRREGPPPKADRPPAMERERDRAPERDRGPDRERGDGERREGMDRPRPPQPDAVREEIEQAMRRIQGAQAELKERAQALRREMAGASDEAKARIREAMEGLERQMRELEAKKREIMENFALRRPPEKPDGFPPIERLERRLDELRKEIARAREEDRMDAVERLEKQIAETERLLHIAREGGPRPPEAGPPGPPPEVLERRIAELREQLGRALDEGKEEMVRELERRIEELHRQLRARAEGRPLPPPVPPERMERVRRAAELLRREGLGDMAELLLESARPKPPGPPAPPPHRDGPPPPPPPPHHDGPPPPHEPR